MTEPLLEVIAPGLLTSVQDHGRFGVAHLGISPGGAADCWALEVANALVGNDAQEAALEMTMVGGTFRFHQDVWIALAGGSCSARIGDHRSGRQVPLWTSVLIAKNETLTIGSLKSGTRVYLAVSGGLKASSIFQSRSTYLSGPWGGPFHRALQMGDVLESAKAMCWPRPRRSGIQVRSMYRSFYELRVTLGPQAEDFSAESHEEFFTKDFEVSAESNRRGLRLKGPSIVSLRSEELVSEGVTAGAIQVASSGQALVLFCEQQTTGGYPKIANVIGADLFKLGQLRPGQKIRFRRVELDEAWESLAGQAKLRNVMALSI